MTASTSIWDLANGSLADSLEVCMPHLPPSLLQPEVARRLRALCRRLPPLLSHAGFECRLDANAARVDFGFGVHGGATERALFAEMTAAAQVDEAGMAVDDKYGSSWDALARFAADWRDRSAGTAGISQIYCEFDLAQDITAIPLPSVFLRPADAEMLDAARLERCLTGLLARFDASHHVGISRCVRSLPDPSGFKFLGLMLSRPDAPIRLNFALRDRASLLGFLDAIGWPGHREDVDGWLDWIARFGLAALVNVDVVGSEITPAIGFECFCPGLDDQRAAWQAPMNDLVERGLCAAPKRDAVLSWPGIARATDLPDLWPRHLALPPAFLGPGRANVFHRTLGHVKVSCVPGEAAGVKAYLFFAQRWLDLAAQQYGKDSPVDRSP